MSLATRSTLATSLLLRTTLGAQSRRTLLTSTKTPLLYPSTFHSPLHRTVPLLLHRHLSTTPVLQSSQSPPPSKVYSYPQIKSLSESPSPSRILIDVREPNEFSQGSIPTAINLPIKSQPDALFLPGDEFEDRFGFEKPGKDKEVIFYCRSGVRSAAAAQVAGMEGYLKIGEYKGSWMDWVEREKEGGEGEK